MKNPDRDKHPGSATQVPRLLDEAWTIDIPEALLEGYRIQFYTLTTGKSHFLNLCNRILKNSLLGMIFHLLFVLHAN
jgi:hypothetical protein